MNKIDVPIGSDHAGFDLKNYIIEKMSSFYNFIDYGTYSNESMDYPDVAHPLARDINDNKYSKGILLCGSGNGVCMTANKYINVRAALCWNEELTVLARQHNDANILCIPARFVTKEAVEKMIAKFFSTSFEGGRHITRIEKIKNMLS